MPRKPANGQALFNAFRADHDPFAASTSLSRTSSDVYGVINAYKITAWLPVLGIIAIFLPRVQHDRAQ